MPSCDKMYISIDCGVHHVVKGTYFCTHSFLYLGRDKEWRSESKSKGQGLLTRRVLTVSFLLKVNVLRSTTAQVKT